MRPRPVRRASLETKIRREEDVIVLELTGEVRAGKGDIRLREELQFVLESGANHLVVRLDDVGLIDSAGLGELMGIHHRLRERGRRFVVANGDPWIRDLLHMTRLDSIFPVVDDVSTAIRLIREAPEATFRSAEAPASTPVTHEAWPID